ncbi:hypothetical protein B0H19DRAFT_1373416 [Mycena capillaripes]|nr:hypothetical protein B0H19DRAFT_1373416 [Mycena capillaripes]
MSWSVRRRLLRRSGVRAVHLKTLHPSCSSVLGVLPFPLPDGLQPPPKGTKEDMQDFLDDLLT